MKMMSYSDHNSQARNDIASRSLGSAIFPEEDSDEGIFHAEVLLATQRWFSSHGWPGGPFPILIPQSLRRYVRTVVLKGNKNCAFPYHFQASK